MEDCLGANPPMGWQLGALTMKRLKTSREVALELGQTLASADVYMAKLRRAGMGPKYVRIGSRCYYRPEHVEEWLDQLTQNPAEVAQ